MIGPRRIAALVAACAIALSSVPIAQAVTKTTKKSVAKTTKKTVKRLPAARPKVTVRPTVPATRAISTVNAPTITGSGSGGSLALAPPSVTFVPTSQAPSVPASTAAPVTTPPSTAALTTAAPTTAAPITSPPSVAPNNSNSVVMMGDSITEYWRNIPRGFFPGKPYVNKGVAGETTSQMVARFNRDVVAANPGAVIILGGINDLAIDPTTGATSIPLIEANIAAMVDSARSRGIRVIIAAVTPVGYKGNGMGFFLNRRAQTNAAIRTLNGRLQSLAANRGAVYVDYFTPLSDGNGELQAVYDSDNVHLSYAAYDVLGPVAERAISQAFGR